MITVVIAENEAKVKEILAQLLSKVGNTKIDIVRKENIVKIMEAGKFQDAVSLKDKVIELEEAWHNEKRGVIYKSIIEEVDKALFEHVLERTEGNQLKAARVLGINRNTMRSKIKKLGIAVERWKI